MKFRHQFELKEATPTYRVYKTDGITIRLDFFNHMIRAAILHDGTNLLPTWTVQPRRRQDPETGYGFVNTPQAGRNKLSCDDMEQLSPEVLTTGKGQESFTIDDVTISIDLFNFRMKYERNGKLLFQDREYIAYNFDGELGDGSCHYVTREPDEEIFGLGDKTGPVNKNKRSYRMEAGDAMGFDARSSDPLYKQLPFYMCRNSAGCYGMYYDTYSNGTMNFGAEINNYYAPFKSFTCDEENLVYYVIFGDIPQILQRFSALTGPVAFPPKWTFAYCGSTMSYTDAPDADNQLRTFLQLCQKHGITPGGFYLSSGYTQIGKKRYVFHWNTDKVPSPEGLASYFAENGVDFLPNVKPAFLINHPLYNQIADKGWFLHYADGTPAVFPFWDDYGSYLDFTNPDAFAFWSDCVKRQLVDKGYLNMWNDNNEYDIHDKAVLAHGFGNGPVPAHRIRPLFSFLMTLASCESQNQSRRISSVSRCGIGGLNRIATTWTGDNNTCFDDFRYNHRMAMTMSLSGFYNFGQDIGGFAGNRPEPELFLRWIQYGIFTPRFVLHSWNSDGSATMPWLYPNLIPTVKKLFDLRNMLIPYLYTQVWESARQNKPVIYPVFLEQSNYDTEADCFMFGSRILAVPVFDKGVETVTVTLPDTAESWYRSPLSTPSGSLSLSPTTITLPAPTDAEPVWFVKAGSVLPLASGTPILRSRSLDNITFTVYPLTQGSFTATYLDDDGVSWLTEDNHQVITFTVDCTADTVTVHVQSTTASGTPLPAPDPNSLNLALHPSDPRKLVIA